MFRQINVSAPSKVILHGEHAVVYGKSAVAASLDLRTRMCLTPILNENVIQVDFPNVGVKTTWTSSVILEKILCFAPKDNIEINHEFLRRVTDFVVDEGFCDDLGKAALICFFYLYAIMMDKVFVPMNIKVESEIPLGAGLGSSAALSVCLAAGLHAIHNQKPKLEDEDRKTICQYALISEKILHGNPSGIDNAVSTFGGFVHFKQGNIVPLEHKLSLQILLVNTKVPRQTNDLVEKVRNKHQRHPTIVKRILEAIDAISTNFLSQIKNMDEEGDTVEKYQDLNQLISYNHNLLSTLGVSHPKLEEVVNVSKSFGLEAKLTGAGGGGFAFVLLPPFVSESKIAQVKEKLTKRGFSCNEAKLGVNGVCVQTSNSDNECISQ